MGKVILHQLAPADSPIYEQPTMIGGQFSKLLCPNETNEPSTDSVLSTQLTKKKRIKRGGKTCQLGK